MQLVAQGADAVSWTSDRPDIASVDGKGQVSALSAGGGGARITASAKGHNAVCVVTVFRKEEYTASSAEELSAAVAEAQGTVEYPARIVLTGDITINNTGQEEQPVVIGDDSGSQAKYVCLDGGGHYGISAFGWGALMLKVSAGSRLVLQDITLDGGGIASISPMISVQNAELILAEGTEVCNLKNSLVSTYSGSINLEDRSTATLKAGSAIRNIRGAAIFVEASSAHVRFEGGDITDCGVSAYLLYRSSVRESVPLLFEKFPGESERFSMGVMFDPQSGRQPVARGIGEMVLSPENFSLSGGWDNKGYETAAVLEQNGEVIEISPEQ